MTTLTIPVCISTIITFGFFTVLFDLTIQTNISSSAERQIHSEKIMIAKNNQPCFLTTMVI